MLRQIGQLAYYFCLNTMRLNPAHGFCEHTRVLAICNSGRFDTKEEEALDNKAESERQSAIKGLAGLASTAILGVVALCHEMALVGMLDAQSVDRVSELMLGAIESAGASPDVEARLTEALTKHFADLRRHLA